MKIHYVAKEQDHGCVIACIAMVLNWNYWDVAQRFQTDLTKKGISLDYARAFVCEHGFTSIDKQAYGYMDVRVNNKRMLQPFGQIHIVRFTQFIDRKEGHAVVMDSKGKIIDPDTKDPYDPLKVHYSVDRVLGFWSEMK